MSVSYTNRKGRTYYLCQGTTKTGKPRYYFAREPEGTPVERMPAGYVIRESVNAIVSLVKARPRLLWDEEIEVVQAAVQKHPQAKLYRVDAQAKRITIYEHVGPDVRDLVKTVAAELGITSLRSSDMAQRAKAEERLHGQFTPVMRFDLTDGRRRYFKAQRMNLWDVNFWDVGSYDALCRRGRGEPDFGHEGAMLAVFQGEGSPPVVSDVAQTQQSAPSRTGADVPAGRQMVPEFRNSPSLPCGAPVCYYPGQEPGALAAHAGICTGVPGNRDSCGDQPLLIYHARLQAADV
jgi:hypothetical protein